MKILAGNGCPDLARRVSGILNVPMLRAEVRNFSDGEIKVEIFEHIRGEDIYVIQSTCSPVNDNLMELLIMADAARRSDARSIIAVIPYYGYARQDRRPKTSRTPITSRLVADMIQSAGYERVITVDLHSGQQQGFFTIPVIGMSAFPIIVADIFRRYESPMLVSPDAGGVERVRIVAKQCNNADLAIIDKRRPKANDSIVMNIIGDVQDRDCIIVDDMVDTAGTLCKGAKGLKDAGAKKIVAYCTHPVLSGYAVHNIVNSVIDELVVADTIPLNDIARMDGGEKIRVLSISSLLAETILRLDQHKSVGAIYIDD